MRVESSATALSWIPSEAVTGLTRTAFAVGVAHYDTPPPTPLPALEELRRADRFRFANRLAVWAEFDGAGAVVAHGRDGGCVMGSTTVRIAALGATFAGVPMPDLQPEPEIGDGWIRFTQTCGGRTALPAPRPVNRPPYVRLQAPLVWTTLAITLHADGRGEVDLVGASPFPRHWVYGPDGELALKAGVADFSSWMGQPSWRRTPWGEEDSPVVVTAAETALERELSTRLMRHGRKPKIRTLPPGEVLAEQGAPGESLYLLLDGVLSVSVNGEPLGEVGPGAVLGERAVLEGGVRTATLTAVTPVRVAEAPSDALDLDALTELSAGHRREDTLAGTGQ
jgi:Cyclic nucleotide-binding domain